MSSRSSAAAATNHFHEFRRRQRARLVAVVAAVATIVGVATSIGSPAAAAPATVQAKPSSTTSSPQGLTAAAALAQAKQTKAPVVATAMTTPTQQATANPNGTLTLTQSNQPTRVRKNGAWVRLDPTLARNPDGSYSPTATPSQVTLSGGGTDALATLSTSGEELDVTLPMTLPAPTVSGASATYPNVLPDVDLVVTISDQGGFSDAFVVKTAAAAANAALATLRLGATSRHLRLTTDTHGGIAALDAAGHPAYTVAAPIMWDSTPPPASSKAAAKTPRALAQADSGAPVDANSGLPMDSSPTAPGEAAHTAPIGLATTSSGLTLTPSQSLLTASNTVYPVYLDPTLTPDAYGGVEADWLEIQSGYPNTSLWRQSGYQQVGDCAWNGCNGMGIARSFFDWNISPLYGTKVISSQVNFTEVWAPACSPPSGHNATVALEWTGLLNDGQNWNNQPSPSNWTNMDNDGMYGYDPSACPSAGIGFDVTSQVIADVNGHTGDIALGLQAAAEADPYSWKLFSNTAILSTTYDVTPATPSGPSTSPVLPCTTTKPYPIIGKTDLYLYIHTPEAADNVAKPLSVDFAVKNLTTGKVVFDQAIQTSAGAGANTVVPQGTLTGGDYTWDTQSTDGLLTSATSTPCDVTVDTTQPGPPNISSTDYPYGGTDSSGNTSKPVRTPGRFEFSPGYGQPNPAAYRYQVDGGVPITVTATNGYWDGTITPQHIGTNSLSVQALSSAGTPSASAAGWQIVPTPLATPDRDGDFTGDDNPDLLTIGSNAAGGIPPGLWLSTGDGNGHLAPPTNIGVLGTGINSPGSATDWNSALVTHGQFTGDKMQDILAVLADGEPVIYASPGDGTALNFAPGVNTMTHVSGDYFTDPNSNPLNSSYNETITQITAIGHIPTPDDASADTNTAYPDLMAVVHDTNTDAAAPYQLWLLPHTGDNTGNYLTDALPLDSSIDWSTKTITGTSYNGKPALLVRDNATGAIDLYPTCSDITTCEGASWFTASPVIHSVSAATATTAAAAPQIASEDVNNATYPTGNLIPDLWATSSAGAVTTIWGDQNGNLNTEAPIAAGNITANPLTPAGAVRWHNPVSGQDQVDVYASDTNGRLWDYQQQPSNAYLEAPKLVGTGTWNSLTTFGVADWNGDKYPDIVARDNTTCTLNVYPGSASGFTSRATQISGGWCGLTPFGVADWYHNGHQDIVARDDATGILWLYPGDLTGGGGSRVSIGSGFTAGTLDPYGVINFDGASDSSGNLANEIIVRRDTDHTLQLFCGNGTNNTLTGSGIQIGSGFTTDYTFVGFLHYITDKPTEVDLITRQPGTHNLQLFEAPGDGTWTNGLGTTIITSGW